MPFLADLETDGELNRRGGFLVTIDRHGSPHARNDLQGGRHPERSTVCQHPFGAVGLDGGTTLHYCAFPHGISPDSFDLEAQRDRAGAPVCNADLHDDSVRVAPGNNTLDESYHHRTKPTGVAHDCVWHIRSDLYCDRGIVISRRRSDLLVHVECQTAQAERFCVESKVPSLEHGQIIEVVREREQAVRLVLNQTERLERRGRKSGLEGPPCHVEDSGRRLPKFFGNTEQQTGLCRSADVDDYSSVTQTIQSPPLLDSVSHAVFEKARVNRVGHHIA